MRIRSFITAGVLLAALLPAVPYGQALADDLLELRNLPPAQPMPHSQADDPAAPAPGSIPLPGSPLTVPRLENSSPLPSVSAPQERIIILDKATPSTATPEITPTPQRPEDPLPAQTVRRNETTPEQPEPRSDPERREQGPAPSDLPETPVTLEHFLLKTPEEAQNMQKTGNATPKAAVNAEQQASGEKKKPAPSSARTESRQEKQTPDPQEKSPKKTAEKGQPLRIPEGAKEKGDVSFLNGCWVGERPEYHTKRMVRERFCFDENGVGKRFISDPAYAGECVGATRALLNRNGVLHMRSDRMYCTKSKKPWGAAEMTCQGEGEHTPCTWIFRDAGGGRQSYSIRFVRE